MKFTLALLPALMAAASASPYYPRDANATDAAADVFVTETVTALTTYCPSSTEITQGGKTYTVTSATTLTITDCPCTIVKPMPTAAPNANNTSPVPPPSPMRGNSTNGPAASVGAVPGSAPSAGLPIPGASAVPGAAAPTAAMPSAPTFTIATGAGARVSVGLAGGLAALIALVA